MTLSSPNGQRARRFAFLLLLFAVLTVASFAAVVRYLPQLARLWGYDIQSAPLQWGLYLSIFVLGPSIVAAGFRLMPLPRRRESQLRLTFAGGVMLALVIAIYQSRYGTVKLVSYFGVGLMGTFVAALFSTWREWGLVEVIARPPGDVIAEVERRHQDIELASDPWDRVKRWLDLIVALGIIIVSLPISLPLAILVWLQDPGPLLVAKVSVMRAGRSFRQLKLRSMIKNAEGNTGPVPAAPDDRRITWFGSLLRRTHIDELPQMINIALGHMSLVGPRPERTVFVRRHLDQITEYARRHSVRPGLAGMAQVYGDYYSTPRHKLHYDLLYIRRRGPAVDVHLFVTALGIAFLGLRPRAARRKRERVSYGKAYRALRGDGPSPDGSEDD